MRCFGLAEQKTPVGDIDLKSPSVEDRRKVSEEPCESTGIAVAGPNLSLQR
jgi:hypothetical protein